jgi:thiamine kinase-like enzyme
LHCWSLTTGSECRLDARQALQYCLAGGGLPVPRPSLTREGYWSFTNLDAGQGQSLTWALETWMPGEANYWPSPTTAKLQAALAMLARIHRAASCFELPKAKYQPRKGMSPAIRKRARLLEQFVSGEFYQLEAAARRQPLKTSSEAGLEAVNLALRAAPAELVKAHRWQKTELPLQWRHGDPWHDHILFNGDEVTGVIDFAAADVDSPAGDIARLLGSLTPDDRESWQLGFEAYESLRPLSKIERDAVSFFDSSGVVLSAINWVNWLFCDSTLLGENVDPTAGLERLQRLVARLRILVDSK